jgi:hypothetical protein
VKGEANWVKNFVTNNPIEGEYLAHMGIIRALNLSYQEVIWMEKNEPYELMFYQHFLKHEAVYEARERDKQLRKLRHRRR